MILTKPFQQLAQMFNVCIHEIIDLGNLLVQTPFTENKLRLRKGKYQSWPLIEELWPEYQHSDGLANDLWISLISNASLKNSQINLGHTSAPFIPCPSVLVRVFLEKQNQWMDIYLERDLL